MNGNNHNGYWVGIYIQGVNDGDVIYPMFYKLPDDDESYKLTEYMPYGYMLVPTPVTEIVSKGANLFDYEAFLSARGFTKQANGYWKGTTKDLTTIFTNTEQREGQIAISFSGKRSVVGQGAHRIFQ